MSIEGTWWYLVEEEPFDEDKTAKLDLAAGIVFDARTSLPIGTYEIEKGRIEIAFTGKSYVTEAELRDEYPSMLTANERHPGVDESGNIDAAAEEMVLPALLTRTETVVVPMPLFEAAG